MVAGCYVTANKAQALGHGIEHVFTLDLRVFPNGAGIVFISLRGSAIGSQPTCWAIERWGVQAVLVPIHGGAIAATGIRGATGAVVVDAVTEGGWAGGLGFDVGGATRLSLTVLA